MTRTQSDIGWVQFHTAPLSLVGMCDPIDVSSPIAESPEAYRERIGLQQVLQEREESLDRWSAERLKVEQAIVKREKSLERRSAELRKQNRQLGARESELEAKLRK